MWRWHLSFGSAVAGFMLADMMRGHVSWWLLLAFPIFLWDPK